MPPSLLWRDRRGQRAEYEMILYCQEASACACLWQAGISDFLVVS